mmetsp:Transcript_17671/g.12592  ORF Transcript_17671/g.12592 Transcript_17671/m.12592 type:complete len:155 (+) Transcript_17671:3182-3646(+)
MPLLAIRLDRKDYYRLQSNIEIGSFRIQQLKKVAEVSNLSVAYWKFKQDDIMLYNITSLSTFSLLLLKNHPILGFLHSFDLLEKRVLRFSLYNIQVGLYALVCVSIFACLRNSEMSDSSLEQADLKYILSVAALGMIILLPISSSFSCLRDKHS